MSRVTHSRRSRRETAGDNERRYILDAFHRSGLSRRAFCAETGVPRSTLDWWLARERRAVPTPFTFAEVDRPAPPLVPAPAATWAVELVMPAGAIVRWRERPPVADVVAVLHDARC